MKKGPEAMFEPGTLRDELHTLKEDVSRLLHTTTEGLFDSPKSQAEALANQIKTALNDLGETLSQDEAELARLISNRPVASLASAFALGVVVGLLLRRH
jgi:ElaB/YqjD/DUF883 family membrane-anchored ribosome-binding protein